jgi:hypothetical protein
LQATDDYEQFYEEAKTVLLGMREFGSQKMKFNRFCGLEEIADQVEMANRVKVLQQIS